MNFRLSYYGSPGDVSAELYGESGLVTKTTGLKDGRAARRWAKKVARDHKVTNMPEPTENEQVITTINGSQSFTL